VAPRLVTSAPRAHGSGPEAPPLEMWPVPEVAPAAPAHPLGRGTDTCREDNCRGTENWAKLRGTENWAKLYRRQKNLHRKQFAQDAIHEYAQTAVDR
jgi:hypothetical protein